MRTTAVLLLLANLALLAWLQGWLGAREAPQTLVRAPFQQAPESLILLGELPDERLALMARIASSQAVIANAEEQLVVAREEISVVQEELAAGSEPIPASQAEAAPAEPEQVLTAAVEEASPIPAPPLVPWCATAGGFPDERVANDYVAALAELGVNGILEGREEPVSSTWWVHMPAFNSEAAARRMLEELQAKNIDSFYMRTGEMAGGISLGVFSRQASALIAQQQLADQGYATSIREVFRLGQRYYVDIAMPDSALLESPEWAAFMASEGGFQVSEKLCEVIAPENQFP
jgi:hypothetical protein